jgi:hypothetical protein
MQETYIDTWCYANYSLNDDCNVVMFSSGLGDGVYGSFWGFDGTPTPVCLVTDFGITEPPDDEDSAHIAKKWWQFWK